jgi:hypothetical protein
VESKVLRQSGIKEFCAVLSRKTVFESLLNKCELQLEMEGGMMFEVYEVSIIDGAERQSEPLIACRWMAGTFTFIANSRLTVTLYIVESI